MNYQILFYVGLICFLLFFVITLFLFFYFRIIETVGNLSGITAKRNMKKIREAGQEGKSAGGMQRGRANETSGEIKVKRGKTTTKLILGQNETGRAEDTTLLKENFPGQETTLLAPGQILGFQKIIDIVIVHSQERI